MKDFNNKVALITGAGSGIGRALALQLAEEGCNLALVDWNNETLEETKSLLSSKNISVSTHNFDLRDKDRINELPDKIVELHNNCLLYTSPSPRDRTRSRMPSSA